MTTLNLSMQILRDYLKHHNPEIGRLDMGYIDRHLDEVRDHIENLERVVAAARDLCNEPTSSDLLSGRARIWLTPLRMKLADLDKGEK